MGRGGRDCGTRLSKLGECAKLTRFSQPVDKSNKARETTRKQQGDVPLCICSCYALLGCRRGCASITTAKNSSDHSRTTCIAFLLRDPAFFGSSLSLQAVGVYTMSTSEVGCPRSLLLLPNTPDHSACCCWNSHSPALVPLFATGTSSWRLHALPQPGQSGPVQPADAGGHPSDRPGPGAVAAAAARAVLARCPVGRLAAHLPGLLFTIQEVNPGGQGTPCVAWLWMLGTTTEPAVCV